MGARVRGEGQGGREGGRKEEEWVRDPGALKGLCLCEQSSTLPGRRAPQVGFAQDPGFLTSFRDLKRLSMS